MIAEVGWVGVCSFGGKSLSVIGSPLIVLEAEGGDFFLVFFVFFGCRALVDHGRNGKEWQSSCHAALRCITRLQTKL